MRISSASLILNEGEIAALSSKFAEGLARVRDVTDTDGLLPAYIKALFMAAAAGAKGHESLMKRELARAKQLGLSLAEARGASVALLISRGEHVYERFAAAINTTFGEQRPTGQLIGGDYEATVHGARKYFNDMLGFVPEYVELMATQTPRALEGYFLMREWALNENPLGSMYVELLLCTVNAAEYQGRFVSIHAKAARRAGASESAIVEAAVCALPVGGVAAWLPAAEGILQARE